MSQKSAEAHHKGPGYTTYLMVWLALVAFTAVTVAVAGVDLKALTVTTALAIATIKTTLVVLYFMHLKYESRLLRMMLLVGLTSFVVFIGLTFLDIAFR